MNNLGFCVFGRPTQHEFISNGLFQELRYGEKTYLNLPGNVSLQKGNKIATISREAVNEIEIIRVLVFEYAESIDGRPGGFVGSGIAFSGVPTKKLILGGLRNIHSLAINLLDSEQKFKQRTLDTNAIKLINPSADGLIHGNKINIKTSINTDVFYGLKLEGPLFYYLFSAIQGFMMNPTFRNIDTFYVTEDESLLKSFITDKRLINLSHVLDFSTLFKKSNDLLSEKKIELNKAKNELNNIEEYKKRVISDIDQLKKTSESLKNEISELIRIKENRIKESNNIEQNILSKQNELKNFQNSIDEKKQELTKIKNTKFNHFKELISSNHFREEKNKYESVFGDKIETKETTIKNLEEELYKIENRPLLNKRKIIVLSVLSLMMFFTGFFINYKFFKENNRNDQTITSSTETKSIETEKIKFNAPKEYTISEFLNLNDDDIQKHKSELDSLIGKIEAVKSEYFNDYDFSNFFERKWNFAEIIDYHVEIEKGLARLERIKSIYEANSKPLNNLENYIISLEFKNDESSFSSSKRNEILKEYLEDPKNIYSAMDIKELNTIKDFEKEKPLLFMHFRWMINELSEYKEIDADIVKTNKKVHNVILAK
jgi:hypothetical protein